jgi:GT2 family glycosyltransferase
MKTPLITVLIVNYNSSKFIEFSLFALKRLTANPYNVLVADSANTDPSDYQKLVKNCQAYDNVTLYKMQNP